jgi:hypothetical protein
LSSTNAFFLFCYQDGYTIQKDSLGDLRTVDRRESNEIVSALTNWQHDNSNPKRKSSSNEVEITLIFANQETGVSHEMNIKPSSSIRHLFANYSDQCGKPLRSLRFSYNDKTLFLSTLGKKSSVDLGMNHLDKIFVYSSKSPEPIELKPSQPPTHEQTSTKKYTANQKSHHHSVISLPLTEKELKEVHSCLLSKVHEEAEPTLKLIRQKLNDLVLDCQSPKKKSPDHHYRKLKSLDTIPAYDPILFCDGLGGKAGKTSFAVNVGLAENLYISTKRNYFTRSQSTVSSPCSRTIDLHGCTKKSAIELLDKALVEWMDDAMKGEYPWVVPATIIYGAGNQILSETVETWIKSKTNVANAPKRSSL